MQSQRLKWDHRRTKLIFGYVRIYADISKLPPKQNKSIQRYAKNTFYGEFDVCK